MHGARKREVWNIFAPHHYLSHDLNAAADCWVLKWNDAYVGFCAVLAYPNGSLSYAKKVHRLVILPDFQGMGLGTKFMEALCEMYLHKGYKMYIRTAADSLAYHFDKSPFWKAGPRNGKKGDVSNGAINGRNQNMHIVNSERYSYEYMGTEYAEKPHEELVLDSLTNIDMGEMRKMLKELQQKNYITVVHGKVKQSTELNQICCELGIRTELLYTTTKGVSHIPKRHLKKMKLVSLKPGKRPVYRKVA